MDPVAARIREVIESKGWSVRQLALAADIKVRTLQACIKDGRAPGHEDLGKLCRATNVSILWLMAGQGPMFAPVLMDGRRMKFDGSFTHDGARVLPPVQDGGDEPPAHAAAVKLLDPVLLEIYQLATQLRDGVLADNMRRLLRIHHGADAHTRGRVTGILEGIDPGEKNSGLGESGRTGMARRAGGARPKADD